MCEMMNLVSLDPILMAPFMESQWAIPNVPWIARPNGGGLFLCNVLWVGRPNVGGPLKYNNDNGNELLYGNVDKAPSGYGKMETPNVRLEFQWAFPIP